MGRFPIRIGAVILAIGWGIGISTGWAQSLSPEEIVRRSRQARKIDGIESIATMTIRNAKGQTRVRRFATVSKLVDGGRLEMRLVRFLEPADVRGTGLLTYDYEDQEDEIWFYMPALRKTRRIVAAERTKNFMGSEFTYADMTPPSVEDYSHRLLGEEEVAGVRCWVIESVAKDESVIQENGYSKRIAYIGQEDFMPRRAVYFDRRGERWKVLTVGEVRLIDPEKRRYQAMQMRMENVQNGRSSEIRFEQVRLRRDVPDEYFTVRYLEQP